MGAQSSRVEQPDLVFSTATSRRIRDRHDPIDVTNDDHCVFHNDDETMITHQGDDGCFFLGGRPIVIFPRIKPLFESPLMPITTTKEVVSSKDDCTAPTATTRDSATTILSLGSSDSSTSTRIRIRSSSSSSSSVAPVASMEEGSSIQQLNGCDDEEMDQFLQDLFNVTTANNCGQDDDEEEEDASLTHQGDSTISAHVRPPLSASSPSATASLVQPQQQQHRHQRTHETSDLPPNEVGYWANDNEEVVVTPPRPSQVVVYGSPPEALSTSKRGRFLCQEDDLDSMISDSEASTPCSSPVSLHGGGGKKKDFLPEISKDSVSQETPFSLLIPAPLGQRSQPSVSSFEREQEVSSTASASTSSWSSLHEVMSLSPPDLVSTFDASTHGEAERVRLCNLAEQLDSQGRLEEALDCYELVYEHDEVLITATSISLDEAAGIHLKIGIIHWKMSTYDACLDALHYVLSMYEEAFGRGPSWLDQSSNFLNSTSVTVSETFLMLSRVHLSLGNNEVARRHAKQCLSVLLTTHIVEQDIIRSILAKGLLSLGMTYEADCLYGRALKHYNEALAVQQQQKQEQEEETFHGDETSRPSISIDIAASIAAIGSVQEKLGASDKAMKCFCDALAIYEGAQQLGNQNCQVDVASLLSRIGWICHLQDQDDAALEAYQEAIENFIDVLGPGHRNVASVSVQIGLIHQRRGHSEEALAFYKSALEIQRRVLGDLHNDVAITLDAMATTYESMNKLEKAIGALDHALHVRRQLNGKRHLGVGYTFANLGRLYRKKAQGNHVLARQCLGNAAKIFRANKLPESNHSLVEVTESLREVIRSIHDARKQGTFEMML